MMLLAASPGGTTANLYSHLFRGDVALNISLTAVNSVIAVFTLPFITNFAIGLFMPGESGLGLEFSKTVEVFVIVLGPVLLGMLVRWWKPKFADAMDRPVRIASMIILAIVIIGAIVSNREILLANVGALAGITSLFCALSLTIGFFVPRLFRVERKQAVASAFEIGIHNGTLAIVIAQTVLGSVELSLPAAVYSVLMFFIALLFGLIVARGPARAPMAPAREGAVSSGVAPAARRSRTRRRPPAARTIRSASARHPPAPPADDGDVLGLLEPAHQRVDRALAEVAPLEVLPLDLGDVLVLIAAVEVHGSDPDPHSISHSKKDDETRGIGPLLRNVRRRAPI